MGIPEGSRYFKEVKAIKVLSEEEEALLFKKLKKGNCLSAREQLIKSNLRFVITIANKFSVNGNGLLLEDLIMEGNLGLAHAVEKYKEEKHVRFLTYAVYWIRKFIQKAIDTKGRTIHLPQKKAELLRKIKKAEELLKSRWGRDIYCDEVAEYLNISERLVSELWDYLKPLIAFEVPIKSTNMEELPLYDLLEDNETKSAEELIQSEDEIKEISYSLASLTEKQRRVMELYFGFKNESSFTLEEISQRLNISAERVRQLKEAGLKKFKKMINRNDSMK